MGIARFLGAMIRPAQSGRVEKPANVVIDFRKGGNLDNFPHGGWGNAEKTGRWSCASTADFYVPVPTVGSTVVTVEFECVPFLHGGRSERRVELFIGGVPAGTVTLHSQQFQRYKFEAVVKSQSSWLHIRIVPEAPERPIDVHVSPDIRLLGVFISQVVVTSEVIQNFDPTQIHDTDFLAFRYFTKKSPTLLDIGANTGQTITTIKQIFPESVVHSFEVNPSLLPKLRSLASHYDGVTVHNFGLSDAEGEVELSIPYVDGVLFDQEASIEPGHFETDAITVDRFTQRAGALEIRKCPASVKVGDTLGLKPDIIKIDVEGAESRVVRGLEATIARLRPTLFIENGDHLRVADILETELGYIPLQYDLGRGLSPLKPPRTNTIYVHPENVQFERDRVDFGSSTLSSVT